MELKAIIGRDKKKIGDWNSSSIISHLYAIGAKLHRDNGFDTNVGLVDEFSISKAVPNGKGKNVYIHASELKDASEFYSYLTGRGFVIRDSKLKPRK
ncbi:MAG: hypothetical protein ABIA78_01750 [archaeon]